MDGVGLAAVITASSTALVALLAISGRGLHYVISMTLEAYKKQVVSTEQAKNGEIEALRRDIERVQTDKMSLKKIVSDQANTIKSHELTMESQRQTIARGEADMARVQDRISSLERRGS